MEIDFGRVQVKKDFGRVQVKKDWILSHRLKH